MRKFAVIALLAALPVLTSCREKQGAGDSAQLKLNMTVPADTAPGMMRVFVYKSSDGSKAGEYFLSQKEGSIFTRDASIRCGQYDFVGYNFDIPDTFLRGDSSLGTLQIYTNPISESIRSKFILTPEQAVVHSPDRVVLGKTDRMDITTDTRKLDIPTKDITEGWRIEIKAEGARYAALAGCILSGERTTHDFAGKEETGSIYFELKAGADCVFADYNTFGHKSGADSEITIFVNNGEKILNYTKSVGVLFDEAIKTGSRRIVINDKIIVPAPENPQSGGGGFNPAVGEWKVESGEILI